MLRSVLGRFRTVFQQTVTTPSTSRHLKLLSTVGIVGGGIFLALAAEDYATDSATKYQINELLNATPPMPPLLATAASNDVADLVKETCPAVVRIKASSYLGSGFFITKEGLILTNAHVVKEQKTVTILTNDDRVHHGVVESLDRTIDLALVRIQADTSTKEFPIIKLGDSSKIRKNDFVMAIGSPLGYKNCLMPGVVVSGALSSTIIRFTNFTTPEDVKVCVFPRGIKVIKSNIISYGGSSGAPIINENGEAVAVLSQGTHNYDDESIESATPYSFTISIPSNKAKKFLAEAKKKELGGIQQTTLERLATRFFSSFAV